MAMRLRFLPVMTLVLLLGAQAWADVPRLLNFQGRLADGLGNTLSGQYSVTFSIYDAATGGTQCHSAAQQVFVNAGLFNVNVSVTGNCSFAVPYYLGIKVGTDPEMTPRLPLVATPYSLTAAALVGGNSVYAVGHAANNIPHAADGTVNTNLNASLLDGYTASSFAASAHNHHATAVYECYAQFSNGTWQWFLTNTPIAGKTCYSIGYLHN